MWGDHVHFPATHKHLTDPVGICRCCGESGPQRSVPDAMPAAMEAAPQDGRPLKWYAGTRVRDEAQSIVAAALNRWPLCRTPARRAPEEVGEPSSSVSGAFPCFSLSTILRLTFSQRCDPMEPITHTECATIVRFFVRVIGLAGDKTTSAMTMHILGCRHRKLLPIVTDPVALPTNYVAHCIHSCSHFPLSGRACTCKGCFSFLGSRVSER